MKILQFHTFYDFMSRFSNVLVLHKLLQCQYLMHVIVCLVVWTLDIKVMTVVKLKECIFFLVGFTYGPHPAKIDLNKKWLPKQKIIQNFNIDALGFRKIRLENPLMREIGVTR